MIFIVAQNPSCIISTGSLQLYRAVSGETPYDQHRYTAKEDLVAQI